MNTRETATGLAVVAALWGLAFPFPAGGQESVLDGYVAEGLAANLALRQGQLTAMEAEARLTELRRGYLPSLSFDARYTRSRGGRSFAGARARRPGAQDRA